MMFKILATAATAGALCWPVTSFASADYTERAPLTVSVERAQPKLRLSAAPRKSAPVKLVPVKLAPVKSEPPIARPTSLFAPLFLALGGTR
jgi:hypothetical protein